MTEKKILILLFSLKLGGGAERVISSLTFKLYDNYKVFVLTINNYNDIYPFKGIYYSLNENKGLINKISKFFKISTIVRPFRIFNIIKNISPDLILSVMDPINIVAIITKKIFRIKIPLIISIHTNIELAYKAKMRYVRFLMSYLYSSKSIDKIITISKEVKKFLYTYSNIKKGKIMTVYNGIDIEGIKKKTSEKIENYKEIFYDNTILKFINIGRLIDIKGHKYLINAFSKVKKAIPNSKLFIIGEGPLLSNLKSFVKDLNLEGDIIFLGFVRNPYKYLFNSNIFVLSSLYEGLPTVLLEALACGVPIISTNCKTGPIEILGKNNNYGILVKVKDSEDLAKKMIMLGKNRELRDFYLKMSLIRVKKFDINLIQKKWINIIEALLLNQKEN